MKRYLTHDHGLYTPCTLIDFIAATVTLCLVAAILLGALDGMLIHFTSGPSAVPLISESTVTEASR